MKSSIGSFFSLTTCFEKTYNLKFIIFFGFDNKCSIQLLYFILTGLLLMPGVGVTLGITFLSQGNVADDTDLKHLNT